MIGLINSGASNQFSVICSLNRLDINFKEINYPEELKECDKILFPGVGHAAQVMKNLKEHHLDQAILDFNGPYLGICLGMHLLFLKTQEGPTEGMGAINSTIKKFPNTSEFHIPHMGWNQVRTTEPKDPLFKEIPDQSYFYFAHSFFAPLGTYSSSKVVETHNEFCVSLKQDQRWAVQFHPEISGPQGLQIFKNFEDI